MEEFEAYLLHEITILNMGNEDSLFIGIHQNYQGTFPSNVVFLWRFCNDPKLKVIAQNPTNIVVPYYLSCIWSRIKI